MRATILWRERLNNSVNGNPRYRVRYLHEGDEVGETAVTSSDAAFVYGFNNAGTRDGDQVDITFTKAGRICDVVPA